MFKFSLMYLKGFNFIKTVYILFDNSLRSGPNLMVLVKGLPTYTKYFHTCISYIMSVYSVNQ